MTSFSLTPLTDVPPPEQESFPNFLQMQEDGTDLGGPDADTINFSTGLTATRGVGEFSNVVTVTSDGGSAGAAVGMLQLTSPGDPLPQEIFLFNGDSFIRYWDEQVQIPSDDWTWLDDSGDTRLQFNVGGTYRLTATCYIDADTEWQDGDSTYGAVAGDNASAQARHHTTGDPVDTRTRMQWTDQFILIVEAESQVYLGLYAIAAAIESVVLSAQMQIIIEKIADPAP